MREQGTPKGEIGRDTDVAWLVAASPQVLLRTDVDGNVVHAAGAALEIFGREPAELVGTSALDLLDAADRETATAKLATLIGAGIGAEDQITARALHPDGGRSWVDIRGRLVADPATGGPTVVAVVAPCGDRVEVQRALARVEERYRELVEWLPAIVYEANPGPQGLFLYVSPHIEDMLGYTPEEWMSDPGIWLEHVHPEDREAIVEEERRLEDSAKGNDRRTESEYRMRDRDGNVVWIRDVARLCDSGTGTFWRGVLIDISAEHTAKEALASAAASHRVMIDRLPACVYRAEPRAVGRWEYVSPQIESLLGYTPAEWQADPTLWRASLHADDRERVEVEEEMHAAEPPGTEFVSEYRLRNRGGGVVWVRDRAVMTRNAGGNPMIDGILTDITAERAAADGAHSAADVYRLNCGDCGRSWAADTIEPCPDCGGRDVEAVSLNAALSDLAAARRQVEGLLDGIQRHLDALGTNLRSVSDQIIADAAEAAADR